MELDQASSWRRFNWSHPEWWSVGSSLLAWLVILLRFNTGAELNPHQHHHNAAMSLPDDLLHWMIMVLAMMVPLVADSLRKTAAMSLWSRRHRAITGFLLGYLSMWLIAGVVISLLVSALRSRGYLDPSIAITVSFFVAVAWQGVAIKRRAFLACHRTMPITPNGWHADLDCLQFGWMIGGSCLISCWAMMLMCSLSGHNLAVMLLATFVGIAERYPIRKMIGTTFARSSIAAG